MDLGHDGSVRYAGYPMPLRRDTYSKLKLSSIQYNSLQVKVYEPNLKALLIHLTQLTNLQTKQAIAIILPLVMPRSPPKMWARESHQIFLGCYCFSANFLTYRK